MESEWSSCRGTIGIIFVNHYESALFTIFGVAYLVYAGKSLTGPYPKDVFLERRFLASICLLSEQLDHRFRRTRAGASISLGRFKAWWFATSAWAWSFLVSTGLEWRKLIFEDHLTIATNLFGSTYYSLVGLHASHVIVGICFLLLTMLRDAVWFFPIQTQSGA